MGQILKRRMTYSDYQFSEMNSELASHISKNSVEKRVKKIKKLSNAQLRLASEKERETKKHRSKSNQILIETIEPVDAGST